jgi:hypothetical protein
MDADTFIDFVANDPQLWSFINPRLEKLLNLANIPILIDESPVEVFADLEITTSATLSDNEDINEELFHEWIYPKDDTIARLIFSNYGTIFGGYLRDVYAKSQINDIDAVIPKIREDSFLEGLHQLGYTVKISPNGFVATKEGEHPVEFYFGEDIPQENFLIGPEAEPDFDVNLLAFNGKELFNWMNLDEGVDTILKHIKDKVAYQIHIPMDMLRRRKLVSKGYRILK